MFNLGRLIAGALSQIPPTIGVSFVSYPDSNGNGNHLRIMNTGPATIHGFHFYVGNGANKTEMTRLYRNARDVFGKDVHYVINVPLAGIYLRPDSALYVPENLLPPDWHDKAVVSFSYATVEGKSRSAAAQDVTMVTVEPA